MRQIFTIEIHTYNVCASKTNILKQSCKADLCLGCIANHDGCGYLKKRLPPHGFFLQLTIIVQAISNLEVEDRMRGLAPNLSLLELHLAWLVAKFICSNLASFIHLAGWLGGGASCLPLGTYMAGEILPSNYASLFKEHCVRVPLPTKYFPITVRLRFPSFSDVIGCPL